MKDTPELGAETSEAAEAAFWAKITVLAQARTANWAIQTMMYQGVVPFVAPKTRHQETNLLCRSTKTPVWLP
ncbi:hypothetical protein NDU88_001904 [Pleurodeles waltl]|uniref:Uncharacterized protein n=1 Tax=Pleurodeles waltl TaxID=8319 RepID=A0AAV7LCU1_PLEWA|nr:hypothetical protein NDU88_001904 [Pleurodeles waltl]